MKLMQFNILADGLAQHGNFSYCAEDNLSWSFRWPLIYQSIRSVDPDVLFVQELNHAECFAISLSEYTMVTCTKLESPAQRYGFAPDGCAIFVKKSCLTILDVDVSYFTGLKAINSGYIVVKAKDVRNGRNIILACSHLKAKEVQSSPIQLN